MTSIPYVLAAILAVFLAYAIVAPTMLFIPRFLKRFRLFCPTHRSYANVRLNSFGAAITSAYGAPNVHVSGCNLKSRNDKCDERCLNDADI